MALLLDGYSRVFGYSVIRVLVYYRVNEYIGLANCQLFAQALKIDHLRRQFQTWTKQQLQLICCQIANRSSDSSIARLVSTCLAWPSNDKESECEITLCSSLPLPLSISLSLSHSLFQSLVLTSFHLIVKHVISFQRDHNKLKIYDSEMKNRHSKPIILLPSLGCPLQTVFPALCVVCDAVAPPPRPYHPHRSVDQRTVLFISTNIYHITQGEHHTMGHANKTTHNR